MVKRVELQISSHYHYWIRSYRSWRTMGKD